MSRLIPPLQTDLINEETGELSDVWASAFKDYFFALGNENSQLFIDNNNIKSSDEVVSVGNVDTTIKWGNYVWNSSPINTYPITVNIENNMEYVNPASMPGLYETGMLKVTADTSPIDGFVIADGGTIGSSGSTASTRANDDCEDLFKLIWNQTSNEFCPVFPSKGTSADSDWELNKIITLPIPEGYLIASAGTGEDLTERELGETVGASTHTLTEDEEPSHRHFGVAAGSTGSSFVATRYESEPEVDFNSVSTSANTTSKGGPVQAHDNTHPHINMAVFIKL